MRAIPPTHANKAQGLVANRNATLPKSRSSNALAPIATILKARQSEVLVLDMTASLFAHFLPHLHCSLSALLFSPAETRPRCSNQYRRTSTKPSIHIALPLDESPPFPQKMAAPPASDILRVWGAAGWVDIGLGGAFAIDTNKKTTWVRQFDLPERPTWVALGRYGKLLWEHIVKTDAINFPTEKTGSRIVATLCYPNANGCTIFQSTIPRGAL